MFDLESSIAKWQREMTAAGIKSPAALDELETHLREDVERQVCAGVDAQSAFETSALQIGQAGALKSEFDKVGHPTPERMKRALLTLAGIPNHYLETPMNTPSLNLEPRWATYLKTSAFLAPAVLLWTATAVFLQPKLREICQHAGLASDPAAARFLNVLGLMNFLSEHAVLISGALIATLVLLEWRSHRWPNYRRAVVGTGTFFLNSAVMLAITIMVLLALLATTAHS